MPATREFEGWARSRGSKVAIEFNDIRMTYSEANTRANRIASYLLALEVVPGDRVIVSLHPCSDLPLVLLALLKIGAVYVPVNPEYPQARIDAIADDTQPVLVISQKSVTDKIIFKGSRVLDIAHMKYQVAGLPTDNPALTVKMEWIAYIYYTSGTTGRPKGVTGSHANLIQMLHCSRRRYGISEADTIPAVASFTFSISMFELLSPLTAGGTLLLLERQQILNAEEMAKILRSVTFFHIGPSLLKGVIKHIKHNVADWSVYSDVRHASSGGDMVPPEILNDLRIIFSEAEIFVIYGCSEVSLMGCSYEVPRESIKRTYVGKPFGNVQMLVLDDDDNPVPIGAVGDVCFGGAGVVPGYLNRPELTEKQFFVRNGVRYYRTGDRGRLTSAGLLELLGRRDFQVQVRGMRVEIGDIEYHLRRAPGVRDGVVAMKKSTSGDARLIAYFVPDVAQNVGAESIRQHLLSQLPEFMVPARYIRLSALPLNQNLKIDRNALPDEAPSANASVINRNSPVSETEIALGQIWQGLLGVEFVGLDDNFLLLGGDSILAMEMIFLVHQRLGVRLDGMDVLRESLQVLATICDQAQKPEHTKMPETIRRPLRRNIASQESFYFGPDDSLYGIYTLPLSTEAKTPVLMCGPCGHENARCVFFMKQLAATFAVRDVPVLRFNYFGCEDSSGESNEATLQRWLEDIRAAAIWLRKRNSCRTINVLGVRLGATLAAQALAPDDEQKLFAWDPLVDVNLHIVEQRRMHLEKIEKLLVIRRLRRPAPIAGIEELLGFCYSTGMIRDLSQFAWRREFSRPTVTVLSSEPEGLRMGTASAAAQDVGEEVVRLPVDCGWYDSTRVTAAITSVSISNALLEAITVHGNN
jgi:amino acid adenylation domain-containing protein